MSWNRCSSTRSPARCSTAIRRAANAWWSTASSAIQWRSSFDEHHGRWRRADGSAVPQLRSFAGRGRSDLRRLWLCRLHLGPRGAARAPPAQARTLRATFLSSAIGSDQHCQVDVQPGAHVLLGRDPEVSPHADFLSRDDTVSRRHAVIGVSGAGSPWVRDAYSTNGTFVNNTALPPGGEAPLGNGDRLRLGQGIFAKIQLILAGAEGDGHDGGA